MAASKGGKKARRAAEAAAIKEATPTAAPHIWKPGHNPNDPDAYEGSGWQYVKFIPPDSDSRNTTNRHTLKGGPESGWPCQTCGEMTRVADEYSVEEFLDVVFEMKEEQKAQIKGKFILLLVCPKCETVVQFRKEFLEPIMARYNASKEEA